MLIWKVCSQLSATFHDCHRDSIKKINRLYFKIISLRLYLYNLILDHFLKNDFSEFLNGISDLHSKKIFPEIKNYFWE